MTFRSPGRWAVSPAIILLTLMLAACGGSGDDTQAPAENGAQRAVEASRAETLSAPASAAAEARAAHLALRNGSSLAAMAAEQRLDAVRLAQQATFGPTEALMHEIDAAGAPAWIAAQMALDVSRYTSGRGDAIHRNTTGSDFCTLPARVGPNCWRDWYSTDPLVWDFYRNAVNQPDQLRQRVAFALQQIVVVSNLEVAGTYGFRDYYNNLLAGAFGNYREVLRKVIVSPVMGEYLDHVNNDKLLPNENFARELLQLFSIGTCRLTKGGTLAGGVCKPTYDNQKVREYAFALTGWTYPSGGATAWGCWPEGANCQYLRGEMTAAPALRNSARRSLLGGQVVPAGATAPQALEVVLDSLMAHPNMAPFVSYRLIQHLVGSNPTPAYVKRVATAFESGRYASAGRSFGSGQRGDLAATVAAVLLDAEARSSEWSGRRTGHLREPVLLFTGVLRALNGQTDGAPLGWWWGETLRQHVFRPPSVFNFYATDYPVPGTDLVAPEFGIHNANAALERLNYLTYLIDWGGSARDTSIPGSVDTRIDLQPFDGLAATPEVLVDNLSLLALGRLLPAAPRAKVLEAVTWWTQSTGGSDWRRRRVQAAAFLVFASPDYQVQR